MRYLDPKQIAEHIPFHPYKDIIRITQEFGAAKNSKRYGIFGHTGVDVGEQDRLHGDNLYAPFDGRVISARNWLGSKVGWQFLMESEIYEIDGVKFVLRLGYMHTRGKSPFKNNDKVKRGDVVDISGGIFIKNLMWTGQHTHISLQPRYETQDSRTLYWQPNWFNGYNGYIDPMIFMRKNYLISDLEGKDIKLKNNPDVYLVKNGRKFKYPDEVVYSAQERFFEEHLIEIDQYTFDQIPYGGTLEIDYSKVSAKITKQVLKLVMDNPKRARELFKRYF